MVSVLTVSEASVIGPEKLDDKDGIRVPIRRNQDSVDRDSTGWDSTVGIPRSWDSTELSFEQSGFRHSGLLSMPTLELG